MNDSGPQQQSLRSRRMARLRSEGKTIQQFAEQDLDTGVNLLLRHFIYPSRKRPVQDVKADGALRSKAVDSSFTVLDIPFGKVKLKGYRWSAEGSGPLVAMFHDWEKDASYWLDYLPALLDKGCQILVLDAPASGQSPGHRLGLQDYINAILTFHEHTGPWDSAVGHGLGAAALVQAMAMMPVQQRVKRLATLGMYLDSEEIFSNKLAKMGISEALRVAFWRKLHEGSEVPLDVYDNLQAVARLEQIKGLLIHDKEDERYPYADAERLAESWTDAEIWAVEGFGHELRGLAVQQKLVPFLGAASLARAA